MDDSMKWDMLVAAAGNDLHDIMKEANIVTELREAQNSIPFAAYVPEVPLVPMVPAGEGGDPPLQDEIPAVPAVPEQPYVPPVTASTLTRWETGLQLIRNTIKKYGNDITQRHTLMTGMPASNHDSWRVWGLRLKEQSKQCKWGADYTWEVAALDALLYQCPDEAWKAKILRTPQWTFQEALDYGISTMTSKKKGQTLANNGKSDKTEELTVDRVEESNSKQDNTFNCKRCMTKHGFASCPLFGHICNKCGKKNHWSHSTACGKQGGPPQRGGGQARGRGGGRNQGKGQSKSYQDQKQAGPPQSSTKTVFRKEGAHWVKKKQTVNYVEETVPSDEDSEADWEYDCDRVLEVRKVGSAQAPSLSPEADGALGIVM